MSELLDVATRHYQSLGRKAIEVPEWGTPGAPYTVYARPLTMADQYQLVKWRDEGRKEPEIMALLLIRKLENEAGDPIGQDDDAGAFLAAVTDEMLYRLCEQVGPLFADPEAEVDALKKTSGTNAD